MSSVASSLCRVRTGRVTVQVCLVRSQLSSNPGEYEFKVLRNNTLARSIKFTVNGDGKFDNGIGSANKLGSNRVIVPVQIIGDLDGTWDRATWKTEAFYGNPLSGFTASQ